MRVLSERRVWKMEALIERRLFVNTLPTAYTSIIVLVFTGVKTTVFSLADVV